MLPLVVHATLSFMVAVRPSTLSAPAASTSSRSSPTAMQDNPLARFFGGEDKDKKKAGPLTTGLDALTKDAPLPVKIALGLAKPLIGALETAISEGQEDADVLLDEAQNALRLDSRATALLGNDLEIGAVFSSASSNFNGQKSMQLQCQCAGSSGSGVVALRGESDGNGGMSISQLQLQAGGQSFEVPTLRGAGGGRGASTGGVVDVDGVIDIEVD